MKLNLFSIPIYISNIDEEKIQLNKSVVKKTWFSETMSSIGEGSELNEESQKYLLKKIGNILLKDIKKKFEIKLTWIWENHYKDGDFQEQHAHPGSHMSFIIYKKINQSKTVFFNPTIDLIESYYQKDYQPVEKSFKPECRQGQIIIFPSFLKHMVQKLKDSITIAGNIDINFKD